MSPILLFMLFVGICGQFSEDGQMSITNKKKVYESVRMKEILNRSVMEDKINKQFSFELTPKQRDQFYLHIPVECHIIFVFKLFVHSADQGSYHQIANIQESPPVQITVFENNNRVVAEQIFYFQGTISIYAKQHSTYNIRFYTTKQNRLIIVRHNSLFHTLNLQQTLTKSLIQTHVTQFQSISSNIEFTINSLKTNYAFVSQDQRTFAALLANYNYFQICQAVVVFFICMGQIKIIKNMFQQSFII